MIELYLFGPPRLSAPGPGAAVRLSSQPKRMALLTYLVAASPRGLHRRDTLLGLFWAEADDGHARGALSQSLYVLRSALGECGLITRGHSEVGLAPGTAWCDCVEFENALDRDDFERALQLYRGDFMEGFFVPGAQSFGLWMEAERDRLRGRASKAAATLAVAEAESGRGLEAARYARRAGELAGPDEAVTRWLMTFLDGLGDRAGALSWYAAFAARLQNQYELEPSAETKALAASLRLERGPARGAPSGIDDRPTTALPADPKRRPRHATRWLVTGALAAAAIVYSALWRREVPAVAPFARFALEFANAPPMASGVFGSTIALSPDGGSLVYVAAGRPRRLFLRSMHRLHATPIDHTEGASAPFFSPSGEWIGFVVDGELRKVRLGGGPALVITRHSDAVSGASWGDHGDILFATRKGLWSVPSDGGAARLVAAPPVGTDQVYGTPELLPDGRAALFTIADSSAFHLAAVSLASGIVTRLGVEGTDARWVPSGHIVFGRTDGVVLAAPFDAGAVRLLGEAVPIEDHAFVGVAGALKLDVSETDVLAYVPNNSRETLVLVDRQGRADSLIGGAVSFANPRASPDGEHVVVSIRPNNGAPDLWLLDLATDARRRLTFDGGGTGPAAWTPDRTKIAFRTRPAGRLYGYAIRLLDLDALEEGETLVPPEPGLVPVAFTADGATFLYERRDPISGHEILSLPLHGEPPSRFLRPPARRRAAALSPDERRIAFVSDISGSDEVYIARFPTPGIPTRVTESGGRAPRWSRNGEELFYRTDAGLIAARLDPTTSRVIGRQVLFDDAAYVAGTAHAAYDVLADGRFVMIRRDGGKPVVTVVLNAFEHLGSRRGPPLGF